MPVGDEAEEISKVWVGSEPAVDGSEYVVTLSIDDDHSIVLDRERAVEYVWALLTIVGCSEYDAAVLGQVTRKMGLGLDVAGQLILDLRKDRPPVDADATKPIKFEPIVSQRTHRPLLHLRVDGELVGQWEVSDARQHALHVLDAMVVADLDGAYYRCLTGLLGVEEPRARNVVEDVGNWREPRP